MSDLDYETAIKYELNRFKESVEEIIAAKVKREFEDKYREYVDKVSSIKEDINSSAHDIDDAKADILSSCSELEDIFLPWE